MLFEVRIMKAEIKWKWLAGWLLLAVVGAARPATVYDNEAVVQCPPQIAPQVDATTFFNNNQFIINFTNYSFTPPYPSPLPYETSDTLNYTNTPVGFMSCNMGFRMEHLNSQTAQRGPAALFYNAGTINCGTVDTINMLYGGARVLVSATNVINRGTLDMGFESLLSLKGRDVDLSRGTVTSEPTGISVWDGGIAYSYNGLQTGYWGLGPDTNAFLNPALYFGNSPPQTPPSIITYRDGTVDMFHQLVLPNASFYLSESFAPSNNVFRAVFLQNTNPAVMANVYFPFYNTFPVPVVEWIWNVTNSAGVPTNQYLYLADLFGAVTNFFLVTNGVSGPQLNYLKYTAIPWNYEFFQGGPFYYGSAATPTSPLGVFPNVSVREQYTAYEALFEPTTRFVTDIAGQNVTNLPGRVEITGTNTLNLSRARISSLNYILLSATNHFISSSGARISSPWADINLRSTNGVLAVTNLLTPTFPIPEGSIELWSGRWTNIVVGVTNNYEVLFVSSSFQPLVPARIQSLTLRSTNGPGSVLISDVLNVSENVMIDANQLTLTTNQIGSPTASGAINFLSSDILWTASTPRLQFLTNNGWIQTLNAVFFGSNYNQPYQVFVNRGGITNNGSIIWANDFENSGIFYARSGSIELQQSQTALLTNGALLAPAGDITFASGSLVISNHTLQAGGQLGFTITNLLTDGGSITNTNTWMAGGGVNLWIKPASGDLLTTTIFDSSPYAGVSHTWAAEDRGCSSAGYTNNAALGRLILDGDPSGSLFTFTPAGVTNAIYIDYLELRDSATNRDGAGNFIAFQIDPGMTVYYAQAVMDGVSVAEKMDHKYGQSGASGGQLRWVSGYAGLYSSTNLVYPDGTTNALNTALVQSCDLDSDGDGIPNCSDPTPVLVPSQLNFKLTLTNAPPWKTRLSWNTIPNATNFLFYRTNLTSGDWQLLTNFVSKVLPPSPPAVTNVFDVVDRTNPRFYKVRVDAQQP